MTAVSFTFDQDRNPITLWRDSDGTLQFRHNDECFNVSDNFCEYHKNNDYLRCELNLDGHGKFSVLLLYADECCIVRIGESKIESHKYGGGGMLILQPRSRYREFHVWVDPNAPESGYGRMEAHGIPINTKHYVTVRFLGETAYGLLPCGTIECFDDWKKI